MRRLAVTEKAGDVELEIRGAGTKDINRGEEPSGTRHRVGDEKTNEEAGLDQEDFKDDGD